MWESSDGLQFLNFLEMIPIVTNDSLVRIHLKFPVCSKLLVYSLPPENFFASVGVVGGSRLYIHQV